MTSDSGPTGAPSSLREERDRIAATAKRSLLIRMVVLLVAQIVFAVVLLGLDVSTRDFLFSQVTTALFGAAIIVTPLTLALRRLGALDEAIAAESESRWSAGLGTPPVSSGPSNGDAIALICFSVAAIAFAVSYLLGC